MTQLFDTSVYDAAGQLHEVIVEYEVEPHRRATQTDPPEGGIIIDNIESVDGYVLTPIQRNRVIDSAVRHYYEDGR